MRVAGRLLSTLCWYERDFTRSAMLEINAGSRSASNVEKRSVCEIGVLRERNHRYLV